MSGTFSDLREQVTLDVHDIRNKVLAHKKIDIFELLTSYNSDKKPFYITHRARVYKFSDYLQKYKDDIRNYISIILDIDPGLLHPDRQDIINELQSINIYMESSCLEMQHELDMRFLDSLFTLGHKRSIITLREQIMYCKVNGLFGLTSEDADRYLDEIKKRCDMRYGVRFLELFDKVKSDLFGYDELLFDRELDMLTCRKAFESRPSNKRVK